MPEIDITRSTQSAAGIRAAAQDIRSGASHVRLTGTAGALAGSRTLDVVHDVQSAFGLRLHDAVTELEAVAAGIDLLVTHVSAATGER